MVCLTVAKGENLGEELGLCPVERKVDVTDATQVMTELVGQSEQARARVDRLEADQRAAYEAPRRRTPRKRGRRLGATVATSCATIPDVIDATDKVDEKTCARFRRVSRSSVVRR